MKLKFLLILIIPVIAFGKPTMEGLFRNVNSADVEGELTLVRFMVEELKNEGVLKQVKVEEATETSNVQPLMMEEKSEPKFIKLLLSKEKDDRIGLVQLEFKDNKMNNNEVTRVEYFGDIVKQVITEPSLSKKLFYSLILMYTMNDSRSISDTLKKIDMDFKTNKESIDKEKMDFLKKYKNYLEAIKRDPDLKESVPNPLKPESEEEREFVKKLERSSIYTNSEKIKLVRKENEFFWELGLNNINALFENKTGRLNRLKLSFLGGDIDVRANDYLLFNGVHELPKNIIIRNSDQRLYRIVMIDYKNYQNSSKSLSKRAEEYQKFLTEMNQAQGFNITSSDFSTKKVDVVQETFLF